MVAAPRSGLTSTEATRSLQSWDTETRDDKGLGAAFEDPIETDGRRLATLRDAGEYIAALPKKEHAAPEWQAAMQALILLAEGGSPGSASCGR
ncbi:hypothetical protein [Bradyrhizobium sp. LA7.1]|uniref:hypothetical protein n=1 Tax=Bradyrhizobium sp. LA7.1 TaxID=3156324 RepID=UPI0033919111